MTKKEAKKLLAENYTPDIKICEYRNNCNEKYMTYHANESIVKIHVIEDKEPEFYNSYSAYNNPFWLACRAWAQDEADKAERTFAGSTTTKRVEYFSEGYVIITYPYFYDCTGHQDQGVGPDFEIVVGNDLDLNEIRLRMLKEIPRVAKQIFA